MIETELSERIEKRQQKAFHDLVKFIKWLAFHNQMPNHWLMDADDLEAEMYFVLVTIIPKYIDKPYKEFLVIARTCMTNAIGSLRYKITVTGRKQELIAWSFDHELLEWEEDKGGIDYTLVDKAGNYRVRQYFSEDFGYRGLRPEIYIEQAERLDTIYAKLSDFDKIVLDALLGGNERVALYIDLQRKRKEFVYTNPTHTITPYIVARALCEPEQEVKQSFKRLENLFFGSN